MQRKLTRAEVKRRQYTTLKAAVFIGSILCVGFTFLMFQIMSI